MPKYSVGDMPRAKGAFTDTDGASIDPTSVFATIIEPDGTMSTLEFGTDSDLIQDTDGVYYVDVDLDKEGVWRVRFYSTGTGQASGKTTTTAADPL